MESPGEGRELLEDIQSALWEEADPAQLKQALDRCAPAFLDLLSFKASNPEARAQVQSRHVQTPSGAVVLDDDPDVRQVLLLADELRLDEVAALLFVLAAQEASGEVSAAAAAGVFFDERLAVVQALSLLLRAQVAGAASLPAELYDVVGAFNARLLSRPAPVGGGSALVRRLAELVQSEALAGQPGGALGVVDAYGREVDRGAAVQREHTALCECLLYACCIRQRLPPADLACLLDLLRHLALRARAAPGDLVAQHQASVALLAVLLGMLPLEDTAGAADAEADATALEAVARSAEVRAKVAALSPADDPYAAAVSLGWGVLGLCSGEEAAAPAALAAVGAALDAGALGFLRAGVLGSVPMGDEGEDVRLVAASVVHQLLMLLVEADVAPEAVARLRAASADGAQAEHDAAAAAAAGAAAPGTATLMALDPRGGGPAFPAPAPAPPPPDSLASLLGALAAALAGHPALFLEAGPRYPQLSALMQEVAAGPDIDVPSVFRAYYDVLGAIAATPAGARSMFQQLRPEHCLPAVSWRRFFDTLHAVVRLYSPPQGEGPAAAGQGRASDQVMLATDSAGLCAMAALFERVMGEGAPEEVSAWVRQLESDAGASPCWEVLFQAMCCPVPQELKAALDAAIAALARRPELAAALWERVLAAVVVAAPGGGGGSGGPGPGAGVPRYDLAYQLNEVEARAEDYQEAVAFVRLLNALWRSGGAALADDGRPVAHLTRFVRDEVLATALQRSYHDPSQRWDLVAAGLEHCALCLAALRAPPAQLAADAAAPGGLPRAPGLEVLLDLLGERSAMRAALATLSAGVDQLAHERHAAPCGAAREAAALAALRLLRAGFEHDAGFVEAARRAAQRASYQTLDSVLRHDRARLPLLLDFVRYPHNPALQAEALRLGAALAARTPALVGLLLNAPPDGGAPVAQRLQDGFAACLHDALLAPVAPAAAEAAAGGDGDGGGGEEGDGDDPDARASLVLHLLLDCLEAPAPNLTHLLCGFDVGGGMSPMALLDLRALHTPLRVALEALQQPRLAARRPRLYESCLELVYELAAGEHTGPATLDLLRAFHDTLAPLLDPVACAPLPPPGPARAAALHQRAWLLHILALELHHADTALPQHRDSVAARLAALFAPADGGAPAGPGRAIEVLALAVSAPPAEPQLGAGASPEARRMLGALEVEALLSAPTGPGGGGVRAVGSRGDALIDVGALKDELLARYGEWVARQGGASEALKEAGRAALQYAAQYNAFAEQVGGQAALLAAWAALLAVATSRRFELMGEAAGAGAGAGVGAGAGPVDLVLSLAEGCLQGVAHLLAGPAAGLAPALCGALQAAVARLQERAVAAAAADPLGGLPLPSRCHALLRGLLAAAWAGRAQEGVRLPLYSAICSYLGMCRGPALLRAPPPVVGALLEGVREGGAPAAEQLDAQQMALEDGNVAALHAGLRLLEVVAADAASPNPATATAALAALSALVAADPTPATADALHRAALTPRLLAALQDLPAEAPSPGGQAAALALVAGSQLTLLLRLAMAGPPGQRAAAAERLFALQALPRLAACRALDVQPEEPGFGPASSGGGAPLRQRLHLVVGPSLRVALAVVTALPASAAVGDQAAAFAEAHARSLARVLRDAASPGVRGWEPGDAELEEAALAARLLAELARRRGPLPPQWAAQLQEGAYRAAARFLCGDARSHSPPVARVHAAREAGRVGPAEQRTHARVLALRGALASYLRALSAAGPAPVLFRCTPAADPPGPGLVPTLFLLKDALVQVALSDLPEALGELPALLDALRAGDPGAVADAVRAHGLGARGKAAPAGGAAEARELVVRAAAQRHAQVGALVFLAEQLLATLYQHLRACAPAAGDGAAGAARPTREALGSARDLDQVRRLTEPAVAALERLLGEGRLPGDRAAFDLLLRRTKEQLAML